MINREKVSKATKICKLVLISMLLFFTGYLFSFFYFLRKDPIWDIRIGFPFPHFGYDFMGENCENFVWGYGSGAGKIGHWAILNPILCILICYCLYLIFRKKKILQKIFTLLLLPILIFCNMSFLSFFPFMKTDKANDIFIGFPFKFYEYKYIGNNCDTIIENWNFPLLIVDIFIVYFMYLIVFRKKIMNYENCENKK
ncbi:hypothetical protein [Capnocytophaga canimorsus]|uniref:hypothetical protein n=1 Tax=Capnocytophaga canimorsus TaxID=28188 RepID=UPI001BB39A8A|nr:hypothetical protein [Capnocytophaga canimorsus]